MHYARLRPLVSKPPGADEDLRDHGSSPFWALHRTNTCTQTCAATLGLRISGGRWGIRTQKLRHGKTGCGTCPRGRSSGGKRSSVSRVPIAQLRDRDWSAQLRFSYVSPSSNSTTRARNSAAGAPSTKAWSNVRLSVMSLRGTTAPILSKRGTVRSPPTPRLAT